MMYVRFPLSLRNVEDLLSERCIDVSHETVRHRWNRFGPMFAADIRRQRVSRMRGVRQWQWHLDEMYVRLNGRGRSLRRYSHNHRSVNTENCQRPSMRELSR